MSLLGSQVFANKTTPLWGGAGSNNPDPTFDSVTFTSAGPPVASSTIGSSGTQDVGSALCILDGNGDLGPLNASAFFAGVEANYPRVLYQADSIDYENSGGQSYLLAQVNAGSNGWDLPNVSSITVNPSGVPGPLTIGAGSGGTTLGIRREEEGKEEDYITFAPNATEMTLSNVVSLNGGPVPLTVTEFTSSFTSAPIDALPGTVMASQTFTAPANGKLFIQAIGNFQSAVTTGTSVGFTIDVDGSNISNSTVNASCGNLILDVITPTMAQFPVSGGVVYDISAIAYSATSSGDWNGISGQLFLSFTTA